MLVSSVQINSRLDSQSRLKMITLFFGCHVGVPHWYTNMAAPYWALQICAKYFDEYLKLRKTHRLQTWRSDFNTISWLFLPNGFRIIFLFCFIAWQCKPRIIIKKHFIKTSGSKWGSVHPDNLLEMLVFLLRCCMYPKTFRCTKFSSAGMRGNSETLLRELCLKESYRQPKKEPEFQLVVAG